MLNPFPELLALELIAPTLLRFALGAYFIYLGNKKFKDPASIDTFFETIGFKPAAYFTKTLAVVEILVGILLVIGFFTQIAALVALVICLVSIITFYKYKEVKTFRMSEYTLLLVIALSLLFTGAGFLAFDLPL